MPGLGLDKTYMHGATIIYEQIMDFLMLHPAVTILYVVKWQCTGHKASFFAVMLKLNIMGKTIDANELFQHNLYTLNIPIQ